MQGPDCSVSGLSGTPTPYIPKRDRALFSRGFAQLNSHTVHVMCYISLLFSLSLSLHQASRQPTSLMLLWKLGPTPLGRFIPASTLSSSYGMVCTSSSRLMLTRSPAADSSSRWPGCQTERMSSSASLIRLKIWFRWVSWGLLDPRLNWKNFNSITVVLYSIIWFLMFLLWLKHLAI